MADPYHDQEAWIIGTDDVLSDPDGCTYEASCGLAGTKAIDDIFLVRILVANTGIKASSNEAWQLYYNTSDNPTGASQVQTGNTNAPKMANAGFTDTETNTNKCTGTGTWQNGWVLDNADDSSKYVINIDYYTEFVFVVQFDGTASGDYYFFVRQVDLELDAHTGGGAKVTVSAPPDLSITESDAVETVNVTEDVPRPDVAYDTAELITIPSYDTASGAVNYRVLVSAADIDFDGEQIRVVLLGDDDSSLDITSCSLGLRDGTSEDYEVASFMKVTFDGQDGIVIPANGEVFSDWIDFPCDEVEDYLVHIYVNAAHEYPWEAD